MKAEVELVSKGSNLVYQIKASNQLQSAISFCKIDGF